MSRVENVFGPRESWGKGNEMERVEKCRTQNAKCRNDGAGGKAAAPSCGNRGAREAKKAGFNLGNHPGINGFVSIQCGGCGKVINTCLREKRTVFVCHGCGHETSLERVANIHMKCARCGFTGKYRTNRTEEQITMECLGCSAIVPMKRVRRGNYVPEAEA